MKIKMTTQFKIIALIALATLCFTSCDIPQTYCMAQKDLLQIENNVPVIPLNLDYSVDALETAIVDEFDDLDSICGRSSNFLVPFDFNKNEIKASKNATLLSFSAIKYCPDHSFNRSRYGLFILVNQYNELLMQGERVSRFELTEQLEKWYFGIPEEQERTLKKTTFHFIYNTGFEEPVPQDSLIETLHALTDSYLTIAERIAQDMYKRPVCKLSATELKGLKKRFPFHVVLRLKVPPVPPPPPLLGE